MLARGVRKKETKNGTGNRTKKVFCETKPRSDDE
jgi:hypothetical protein